MPGAPRPRSSFLRRVIALAVLALLQTLPEFAAEAIFAWHREVQYLFASLTGALMLLTGIGWPMIYFSAATAYRKEHKRPMRLIRLEEEQAVQIVSLFAGISYEVVIWWKGSLNVFDGIVLIAIYGAYLWIMRRIPPRGSGDARRNLGRAPRDRSGAGSLSV